MKLKKDKSKNYRRFIPWITQTPDLTDEESSEDNWMTYIHKSLHPYFGEESPFPGSEWSYTKHDSVFDRKESSDFELHQEILEALYDCEEIDASEINVNVLNGVVILSGYVKTEYEIGTAAKVVQDIAGVWNIRNELKLDTSDGVGSPRWQR